MFKMTISMKRRSTGEVIASKELVFDEADIDADGLVPMVQQARIDLIRQFVRFETSEWEEVAQ